MSIEKPQTNPNEGQPVVEAMEELIKTQIKYNEEYRKLSLTPEEIRAAAMRLSNAEIAGSDAELAEKAIRAQVRTRATRGPVTNGGGEVIGMAGSREEASAIAQKDIETRDGA